MIYISKYLLHTCSIGNKHDFLPLNCNKRDRNTTRLLHVHENWPLFTKFFYHNKMLLGFLSISILPVSGNDANWCPPHQLTEARVLGSQSITEVEGSSSEQLRSNAGNNNTSTEVIVTRSNHPPNNILQMKTQAAFEIYSIIRSMVKKWMQHKAGD